MPNSINPSKRSHPCKGMTKAVYRTHLRKHVKLWQASGLSKADYAAQIGISKDTMRNWVRDFGAAALPKTAKPNLTGVAVPKQTQPAATLVPVRIQTTNQSHGLKLTRPDGIILEWSEAPPSIWLAELLRNIT
jgi:DNA-binding transcriptional regulator YiaG